MGIRKKCLIITLLCFSSLMHASEFMFKHLEVKDGLTIKSLIYLKIPKVLCGLPQLPV